MKSTHTCTWRGGLWSLAAAGFPLDRLVDADLNRSA
jgi:hypothetical protein